MVETLRRRIDRAVAALRKVGYKADPLSVSEFLDYVHGETTQQDLVTPEDIVASEPLMVHEVAEVSELKRMGLVVGSRTAVEHPDWAYEAHLTAMQMELAWSEERGDREWVRRRVRDLESYLSDPTVPERLVPRCRELIARYRPADHCADARRSSPEELRRPLPKDENY